MERKSKTKPMPVDTKNQDCETCKCADGGKCYHFAFMGKSGNLFLPGGFCVLPWIYGESNRAGS